MARLLPIFLGPELYWLALYVLMRWLGAKNVPATAPGNAMLERVTWLIAGAGVALAFGFIFVPGANRWIMLVRMAVAGFIGVNACAIVACDRINYPELGRNSGLMGLWMLAVMLGGAVYVVGSIITLIALRWHAAP